MDDGSVKSWGQVGGGPGHLLEGGVVNIFSNDGAFAALKDDGSLVTWGAHMPNYYYNISGVVDIFSNKWSFAALKDDGSIVTLGQQIKNGARSSYQDENTVGGPAVTSQLESGVVSAADPFHDYRLVFPLSLTVDAEPPAITSGTTATAINENSGSGQVVYTATATDASNVSFGLVQGNGLKVELYEGKTFNTLRATNYESTININDQYDKDKGGNGDTFSVRATGQIQAYAQGSNTWKVRSDDGVRIWIDDVLKVNRWNDHGPTWDTFTVNDLEKDSWHDIKIEFYENGGGAVLDLYHSDQSTLVTELRSDQVGTSDGSFTINSSTGAVTLTNNPDHETKSSYTFTLVATDAANNSTRKDVSLAINDVAAASTPDLSASSDSGISNSDNITSDKTPTFTGTASANDTVAVSSGGTSLGSTVADGSGAWSFTVSNSSPLADGSHAISVTTTSSGGSPVTSDPSAALNLTVDTATTTPSTPDLSSSSDTGQSSTDNITSDKTPTFTGTAEAGSTVELFAGTSSLGTTTADNSGNWSFTVESSARMPYRMPVTP